MTGRPEAAEPTSFALGGTIADCPARHQVPGRYVCNDEKASITYSSGPNRGHGLVTNAGSRAGSDHYATDVGGMKVQIRRYLALPSLLVSPQDSCASHSPVPLSDRLSWERSPAASRRRCPGSGLLEHRAERDGDRAGQYDAEQRDTETAVVGDEPDERRGDEETDT